MSRAFIKEDAGDDRPPERPRPSGPNYVTPRGLGLLRKAAAALEARRANLSPEEARDLRYWQARLGEAIVVDNAKRPPEDVRFGATVEVRDGAGKRRTFRIVGQDEALEGGDLVAWDSVRAYALNGRRDGQTAAWTEGEAEVTVTILSVRYEDGI